MPRIPDMHQSETSHFITFDTHKYIKELEASGFPEQQAEVLIKSMLAARYYDVSQLSTREQVEKLEEELVKIEKELTKFATREQVEKLEKTTREQVEKLEKELTKFATREQLQVEMANVKYDILKWIIPMLLGIIGMMLSIFMKLH